MGCIADDDAAVGAVDRPTQLSGCGLVHLDADVRVWLAFQGQLSGEAQPGGKLYDVVT